MKTFKKKQMIAIFEDFIFGDVPWPDYVLDYFGLWADENEERHIPEVCRGIREHFLYNEENDE